MKKRIVIKVGYRDILLGKGAEIGAILAALDEAIVVEHKGYGREQRFNEVDEEIEVKLYPEDIFSPAAPKEQAYIDDIKRANERYGEAITRANTAEKALKELKEKFAPFMPIEVVAEKEEESIL